MRSTGADDEPRRAAVALAAAWGAIKDASALGWGRTFVAALLRATARRPMHTGSGELSSLNGVRPESGMRMM